MPGTHRPCSMRMGIGNSSIPKTEATPYPQRRNPSYPVKPYGAYLMLNQRKNSIKFRRNSGRWNDLVTGTTTRVKTERQSPDRRESIVRRSGGMATDRK